MKVKDFELFWLAHDCEIDLHVGPHNGLSIGDKVNADSISGVVKGFSLNGLYCYVEIENKLRIAFGYWNKFCLDTNQGIKELTKG